jgi:phosphoribosylanthranilate isomerase
VGAKLKVCGLTRRADFELCIELGVDAVGLNFWPRSKRGLSLEGARALVDGVDRAGTQVVGVFVEASVEAVAEAAKACQLDAVQLHGNQNWADFAGLSLPLVRVVRGTPALETLGAVDPEPWWTILDAAVEGFGGQGHTTDWEWAAKAVKQLAPDPVWLAGGIKPGNCLEALRAVAPAGVDVASGAELAGATRGEKDGAKIEALLHACRGYS